MAIKIEVDKKVRVFRPAGKYFTMQELNNEVGGMVEPQKVGPVWLMYKEESTDSLNHIASIFFSTSLRGPVLIIPPQELPAEWEAMEEADYMYKAEEVDNGFLLSLQKVLYNYKVFGSLSAEDSLERIMPFVSAQEEWTYSPPEQDEIDENTIHFYNQVYNYISQNPEMFQQNVLISDPSMIITLQQPEQKAKMVQQMIDYFLSVEEYEKCALLQKTIS